MAPFKIKSPLTSGPSKQRHYSLAQWDLHKPLMIAMRMQGKVAEEIRSALRDRGFNVGIGPIKRLLSDWAPKNSTRRRKRFFPRPVRTSSEAGGGSSSGPATNATDGNAVSDNSGDVLMVDAAPDQEALPSASELVVTDLAMHEIGPGQLRSDLNEMPNVTRAEQPHEEDDIERDIGLTTEIQGGAEQLHEENDTERDIALATEILASLELDISDRTLANECLSFDEWCSQQDECGSVPVAQQNDSGGIPYGLAELLQMVHELAIEERIDDSADHPGVSNRIPRNDMETSVVDENNCSGSGSIPNQSNLSSQSGERGIAMKQVDTLLENAQERLGSSHIWESFVAARDAFAILKKYKPLDAFKCGMALYWMAWPLVKLAKRFPDAIKMLAASSDYFEQCRDISWELRARRSLAMAQVHWPACEYVIQNTYGRILARINVMAAVSPHTAANRDILWANKMELVKRLAVYLPADQTVLVHRKALSAEVNRWGLNNKTTALSARTLATKLSDSGSHAEAVSYMKQAYQVYLVLDGPTHLNTVMIAGNLHYILLKSGRFHDALQVFKYYSPVVSKAAAWDPDMILHVGRMLTGLGNFRGGLTLLQRSFNEMKYHHGEGYVSLLEAEEWIADALYQRGLILYAQPVAIDYMNKCERVLGRNHPRTLDAILFCLRWGVSGAPQSLVEELAD